MAVLGGGCGSRGRERSTRVDAARVHQLRGSSLPDHGCKQSQHSVEALEEKTLLSEEAGGTERDGTRRFRPPASHRKLGTKSTPPSRARDEASRRKVDRDRLSGVAHGNRDKD